MTAAGETASFQALYERHFDFVWRTLRHLGVRTADLSDASQDVFIVVYRRLSSFEARGKFTTWLFQICFNVARNRRRLAYRRNEVSDDESALERVHARGPDPFADAAREEKLALFEAALERMAIEQRAAFILFEIEGMTGPEAASAMGVPQGTAYSRLRLARITFRETLARASLSSALPARRGGTR